MPNIWIIKTLAANKKAKDSSIGAKAQKKRAWINQMIILGKRSILNNVEKMNWVKVLAMGINQLIVTAAINESILVAVESADPKRVPVIMPKKLSSGKIVL